MQKQRCEILFQWVESEKDPNVGISQMWINHIIRFPANGTQTPQNVR